MFNFYRNSLSSMKLNLLKREQKEGENQRIKKLKDKNKKIFKENISKIMLQEVKKL